LKVSSQRICNVEKSGTPFFVAEHTIAMLAAIILIHMGYSFSKDVPDAAKHKRLLLLYGLALLIILISVPGLSQGAGRA
jgi:uncharacterized membrane protein